MDRESFERLTAAGAFGEDGAFRTEESAPPSPGTDAPPEAAFARLGLYSLPELTAEEREPPEFLIEGMLPVGLSFLSGAPKTRKSFLAVQMAAAVAAGTPFLGRSTHRCDVAYLDLEGSKSRISQRTEQMSFPVPPNVYFTNTVRDKLSDALVEVLRALHRERPSIRFIVVDTFSRARGMHRVAGANAYDADMMLLEPVQRMAIGEKIAVLFIHHDRKGAGLTSDSFERLSGTMGISGSADCVMNLICEGKRFDGRAKLEFTPRDAQGGMLALEFDGAGLEWRVGNRDLRGNPVCRWLLENAPEKGKEGRFLSYEEVCLAAYRVLAEKPGETIKEQVMKHRGELFSEYGIGVQVGVQSNCRRGLRVINLN